MLRRLIEADYHQHRDTASDAHIRFWVRELRTPQILIYLVQSHAGVVRELASTRALLAKVLEEDFEGVIAGLEAEERREREADRAYWRPLKEELERIRHAARLNRPPP